MDEIPNLKFVAEKHLERRCWTNTASGRLLSRKVWLRLRSIAQFSSRTPSSRLLMKS